MTDNFLPSFFVPLVGIIFPGITMSMLFIYIEKNQIS